MNRVTPLAAQASRTQRKPALPVVESGVSELRAALRVALAVGVGAEVGAPAGRAVGSASWALRIGPPVARVEVGENQSAHHSHTLPVMLWSP